jgi:PAS domain S-box-containing protein
VVSNAARRRAETAALDVEYRIRRGNDGALRWIARKAEFERDSTGKPTRMVGVVQDITERRATQQALADSAAQFQTFAQALPNHVWTAKPDGMLDWFNDQVYEYGGDARGSLDGAGWARMVHPEDLPAAQAAWQHSLASGEVYETEFRMRRADGAYRWHLARALPLRGSDGQITRWIGTNTDIHERRLAQAESTRDRDRIWTLSQELMLICDFDGVIADVNPTATRLLGYTSEEMVGRALGDFIHPDDRAGTAAEIDKLAGGISTQAFENRYRTKDGSYRLLSWTAVPDRGYVHAVARDVTRERATEQALGQSQKLEAIGQLTGGVAHDFNNVLAVIKASMELLRRQNLAPEKRERFMDAITNAVERATKLTGQLLAYARRQALQPEVFDAGQNTRAVSEMIASLTGSRIETVLRLAPQACYVLADPSQFDTALINLALNGRDAMPDGGRLTLHVTAVDAIPGQGPLSPVRGNFVAISIGDTGSGIAPEHMAQIFEPFFTTKSIGQGTGLGLSQVFGFAKQSGGDVRVASVVGEGSTFTLYLPQAELPAVDAESAHGDAGCRWAAAASWWSKTTPTWPPRSNPRCRSWAMRPWSPPTPAPRSKP